MRKLHLILIFTFAVLFANAQVEYIGNKFHVGRTQYTQLTLGEAYNPSWPTYNNGEWALEEYSEGLNFCKNWPSTSAGDYKLFIHNSTGNVVIGGYNTDTRYKLYVYGEAYSTVNWTGSDKKLKKNIKKLDKTIDKLKGVNGYSYIKEEKVNKYWEDIDLDALDEVKRNTILADIERSKTKKEYAEYGVIAQEIQTVFPELVSEGADGYLAVNYNGLTAVLLEAVKEQQAKIESLELQVTDLQNCCKSSKNKSATTTDIDTETTTNATLYQNTPNPFTYQTEIAFYLPENITTANIYVFNMQGTLIKTYPLTQRGNGTLTINGGELQAGMYFYTLTTDGKEVDTKKMILTE